MNEVPPVAYTACSVRSSFPVIIASLALFGSACSEFVPAATDVGGATTGVDVPVGPCSGVVCDDEDECTIDSCDGQSGACVFEPRPEGSTCDDGLFCTVGETCTPAGCSGGVPRECPDTNGGCRLGACDEDAGKCQLQSAAEGAPCEDGDLCTIGASCNAAGLCLVGVPIECIEPAEPCLTAACDPATGECKNEPLADSAVCDDGDACTDDDACSEGKCKGGPKDCSGLDAGCTVGFCADDGSCQTKAALDTTACDDGQACTENDFCLEGTCAGTAVDCSAFDGVCAEGICNVNTGDCASKALSNGESCDDGDA